MGTLEKDSETNSHFTVTNGQAKIIDTISYKYLEAGQTYVFKGILMILDTETGEAIPALDEEGNPIVGHKKFTVDSKYEVSPFEKCGEETVEFNFDSAVLKGNTIVVYEYLYKIGKNDTISDLTLDADGNIDEGDYYLNHADAGDVDQTGYFPEIGTTAVDSETNDHLAKADEETTIIDTVKYAGLKPGLEYVVKGVLMDKVTGTHCGIVSKTTTIVDVVSYSKLCQGTEYTVTGTLMKKEDGKPLLDEKGDPITATKKFTTPGDPDSLETISGSIELEFTFDSRLLCGKSIVVFEEVDHNDIEVFTHADINDEPQTVHYPSIGTKATGVNDEKVLVGGNVTIKDLVEYDNLVGGETYKVSGILIDKSTGKAIEVDGEYVTSEATFVAAESGRGTVDVIFKFNSAGLIKADEKMNVVVFEKLYDVNGNLIVTHEDLDDGDQTVTVYEPSSPKTGDNMPIIMLIGFLAASLVGLIVSMRKRRV